MQEQRAIIRVTREHYLSFASLPFHRGITVSIDPHPHGNPVRRDPVPTVLP